MSNPERFKMPFHDDPLSWPRALRKPGTVVVLATDYDALTARVAELGKDAARYRWLRTRINWKEIELNRGLVRHRYRSWEHCDIRSESERPSEDCIDDYIDAALSGADGGSPE